MSEDITRLNAALQGRYAVARQLGEGGMATVYLATDLRHDRQVALKVLKAEVAAVVGAERFLAEIKTTAALTHPNILPLHDSGQVAGLVFYVMPYIEGESLRERLDREGPLPVDEAVKLTIEVADALQAAHEQGIVHRDVKPANILLSRGRPLVADFGIALAASAAGPGRLTKTGLSLGTPHYMSPEQATAEPVQGPATDVYSLGCVLYELLVGEPPHTGASAQAILSKVLQSGPVSAREQRPSIPPNVDATINKALERLPADRFRSTREFAQALRDTTFGAPETTRDTTRDALVWKRVAVAGLVVAGLLLLLAGRSWLSSSSEGESQRVIRGALEPPLEARVLPDAGFQVSPDGQTVAFIAGDADGVTGIWIQPLDALEARPLEGTRGAYLPFWSPDGEAIGFFAGGSLKRIPSSGGAVTVLASVTNPKGGTWSPDGRIVFTPGYRTGLFEVLSEEGEARPLTRLDESAGELSHRWPQFLPDGSSLLFLVQTDEYGAVDDRSRIEVLDSNAERHEIFRANSSPTYAPPGVLLYWREGAIYATDFVPRTRRVSGPPRLIAEGVGFNSSEWANVSASTEGTLVYHMGGAVPWRLEWRDRNGSLLSVAADEGDFSEPELSPDGGRVSYKEGQSTLWSLDLARGTRTRLTFSDADHYSPTWSPDGLWIAYSADKPADPGSSIYRRPSTGTGDEEILFDAGERTVTDLSWSPDGRWIAFSMAGDVHLLDTESKQARLGVSTPGADYFASFSPDGRWMAYNSNESGRAEIYVVAVGEPTERWVVSQRGGILPRWSPQGDELFFFDLSYELQVAAVTYGAKPEFGVPQSLFRIAGPLTGHSFAVAPDGRILVRTHAAAGNAQNFKMILNWADLLGQP
jgi:serine/threonine-protein kinase